MAVNKGGGAVREIAARQSEGGAHKIASVLAASGCGARARAEQECACDCSWWWMCHLRCASGQVEAVHSLQVRALLQQRVPGAPACLDPPALIVLPCWLTQKRRIETALRRRPTGGSTSWFVRSSRLKPRASRISRSSIDSPLAFGFGLGSAWIWLWVQHASESRRPRHTISCGRFLYWVSVYAKARPVVNESPVTRKPSAWELGQPRANGNAARGVVSHVAARDTRHTPARRGEVLKVLIKID